MTWVLYPTVFFDTVLSSSHYSSGSTPSSLLNLPLTLENMRTSSGLILTRWLQPGLDYSVLDPHPALTTEHKWTMARPGCGILPRLQRHSTKHLEHNGKEKSSPTVSKHPDVWHEEGEISWRLPHRPGCAIQAERQQVLGLAAGTSCWPWMQRPVFKAATLSLCRVRSGLKAMYLKSLLLEVSFRKETWVVAGGGVRQGGWKRQSVHNKPQIQIQCPHTCRCQNCGQVKIPLSAFNSQGT